MIITTNALESELDEALCHLQARISVVDDNTKRTLMKLVDAILDAKLEKQGAN